MSFRRDGKQSHQWRQWRIQHREELLAGGVPDSVLITELRWLVFLEHGYDQWTGWSPALLSRAQAQALHAFIMREYGEEKYRGCLRALEQYLERKDANE